MSGYETFIVTSSRLIKSPKKSPFLVPFSFFLNVQEKNRMDTGLYLYCLDYSDSLVTDFIVKIERKAAVPDKNTNRVSLVNIEMLLDILLSS